MTSSLPGVVPSGLLLVDKPGAITSHGAVAAARRALGTRKVGHAGTLDPMATGLLILGVERATRLLGHLALHDKEYLATIRLGGTTVTDDAEGEIIAQAPVALLDHVTEPAIDQAMQALKGVIQQVPSSVSAIKVDGTRSAACCGARASVPSVSRVPGVSSPWARRLSSRLPRRLERASRPWC